MRESGRNNDGDAVTSNRKDCYEQQEAASGDKITATSLDGWRRRGSGRERERERETD